MGKWLLAFVVLIGSIMIISTHQTVYEQSLAVVSWFAWGLDDVLTHYISDSSVSCVYNLKNNLFDEYERIQPQNFQKPKDVRSFQPEEYSYELIHDTTIEPLVFRGLFSSSPAIKKWKDLDYLDQTIGEGICPVVLTNANHFEIHREAKSYHEIFDTLKNDTKSTVYVSGDQFIFESEAGKSLLKDLAIREQLGNDFMNSDLYSPEELYLFLGNRGTSGTSWHCAPNRSMFVQVLGRKRWTFIHPRYSLLLHPQRSHLYSRIFLAGDSFQYFNNQSEKNKGKNNTIRADGEIFSHVPRHQVILEPGDALTVPSWYWHHVENLPVDENEEEHVIIGVDVDTKVWNHSWLYALFPGLE